MPFAVHSSPMPDPWRRRASWLRAACAFVSGAIAIYSLAVWSYGNWHLASLALETVPIAPSTAALLLLLTIAVGVDQLWPARMSVRVFQLAVAGLAVVVSLGEFLEYLIGKDAPWDVLLARTQATVRGIPVGHMSPFTAGAFLLAAFTLITTARVPLARRALQRAGKIAALLGGGFCAVTVLAYSAGTPLFYDGGVVPMALLTAIAFVALNLALLLAGRAHATAHDFLFGRPARAALPGISTREKAIIAGLGAALLLTVGVVSVWWLRIEQGEKRTRIHRELTAIAELKVRQISAWRDEQLRDAKVLMRTPYLAHSLAVLAARPDDSVLRGDLGAWLGEMNRMEEYAAIALFDRQGKPLLVVPESTDTSGPRLQAMLHELPTARTVLEGSLGRSATGKIYLDRLVPIFDGANLTPVGAILLRVDPEIILYPLLAGWPVPSESAETLLLRREGEEIVYLNRLRHDPGAVLTRRSINDSRLLAAKIARGEAPATHEGVDYRGTPVVGAGRAVPGTPWFVIAKVDQAEAYAPLRTEAWRVGAMTVARLTFVALCAGLLWRYRNSEILRREFTMEKEREALARRLALVMEQANDAILLMDESGRILEANDRALTMYGYTLDDLRALPPGGLNPPGGAGDFAADLVFYTAPAGALFEAVHQRRDGSRFPVEVSGRTFESNGQRFKLGVFRDISERKASQQHITRLSQLYAALSQINQAIVHGRTRDELFGRICRVLVEPGQFKMAWIGWNDSAVHQIVPVASYGDAGGYLQDLQIYSDARPGAHGPTGTALREGRTYVCQSFADDASAAPWRERAARHGFLASIELPIRTAGEVVGVLTVYSGQRNAFIPGEVALLEEAADDISFALGNLERDAQRQRSETALRESEARYRTLFARLRRFVDSNIVGVAIAGSDGRIIDANDYYLRLIGFSREEFEQGKVDWRAVTPPEWLAADETAIRELRERGTCTPYEKEYHRRDGTRVPVFLADAFLPGPTEEIAVFALDLTARKHAEQSVADALYFNRTLIENLPVGIATWDETGRCITVNEALLRIVGGTEQEIMAQNFHKLESWRASGLFQAAESALRLSVEQDLETKLTSTFGKTAWVSCRFVPFAHDNIRHLLLVITDITARREAEEQLVLLNTAILAAPNCVVITDERGTIEWVNPAFSRLTGYATEEVVGRNSRILKSGRQTDTFYSTLWQTITSGQSWHGEFVNRRKDGTVYAEDATIAPVRDRAGTIRHFVAVKQDITARKAAERRLREQAEVLDKANDAIVISDLVNRITFWNRGAERLLGSTAGEMIGRPLEHVFVSGGGVEPRAVAAALADFVDWRGELRAAKRGGGSLEIETSLTVLRDESGQPIGRLSISTDITEKKALAQQFLRAQRVESIGMLAAGISHDLNNVLAPIGMATHLLRQSVTGQGDLHLLDTLDKCADRGARLVRQILGFARGVGGEVRLLQVKHLLHDVAEVIAETFPKSIALDDNIPNDLWAIDANPTQIHQVLLNLCVNARDAMPAGGTLRLRAENCVLDSLAATGMEGASPGSWLVLHVEDTGTGISEETLAQIWQPFFTTKAESKGTGLGLSTVRGIVETHHGFVSVESKVGVGTVFRVYLPAARSADAVEPGAVAISGAHGHGELILLVDDEKLIRETASRILTRAGYRVVIAADGVEAAALFRARRTEFALVLTDRDMPGLDGAGLAEQIRACNPAIKILAISGFTSVQADQDEKRPAIGDAFLAKPFTVETLLESVDQLLHPTVTSA